MAIVTALADAQAANAALAEQVAALAKRHGVRVPEAA